MGLKLLHSADWHLDSPFLGFSEDQRELLKAEQRKLPGKIADLCRREDCDLVLLAGDLLDGAASRETLDVFKEALASCGVPVLIAPGNHDYCGPGSPWLEEQWPQNVFVFTGRLESVTIMGLDCRVYGAGFRSMDSAALLEGFEAEGSEKYRIAVMHGDATQTNSHYNPVTAAQVRDSGLDYLALGHIHKAGAFRAGKTLCAWPGCPMGRGWDETGDKGVCIVTLGEEPEIRAVGLDTLGFYDLEADIGMDAAVAVEEILPPGGSNSFYRITMTGDGMVELGALRARFADYPNLELRDRTQPPLDVWATADVDSLEGIYFDMLRKTMAKNPEKASQIQLAAEISRKLLAGREVKL